MRAQGSEIISVIFWAFDQGPFERKAGSQVERVCISPETKNIPCCCWAPFEIFAEKKIKADFCLNKIILSQMKVWRWEYFNQKVAKVVEHRNPSLLNFLKLLFRANFRIAAYQKNIVTLVSSSSDQ